MAVCCVCRCTGCRESYFPVAFCIVKYFSIAWKSIGRKHHINSLLCKMPLKKIWFSTSYATTDNNTPSYLILKNISLISMTFLICVKPRIHAPYVTEKYLNLPFSLIFIVVLLSRFDVLIIWLYTLITPYPRSCVPLTKDFWISLLSKLFNN